MSLFANKGVHCVVDGQFGSTGKGALCAWLAERAMESGWNFRGAIYSGGPNSGHTFYYDGEKHVLKQLPTFAVATTLMGGECAAYISAGAVIDPDILFAEARRYPDVKIYVHPNAAIIDEYAREVEKWSNADGIASTMSGTGGALMRKIARYPSAIWKNGLWQAEIVPPNVTTMTHSLRPNTYPYLMEVSQGFSLGINSEFYPYTTSRECTVMQGLADARIPARDLARTYMAIRTYPIRVGGDSGGWYPDQREITWGQLGVEPELTTVTKRIRRVATFSWDQFTDACNANAPDFVFINFLNYLETKEEQDEFIKEIQYHGVDVIAGYGPTSGEIILIH